MRPATRRRRAQIDDPSRRARPLNPRRNPTPLAVAPERSCGAAFSRAWELSRFDRGRECRVGEAAESGKGFHAGEGQRRNRFRFCGIAHHKPDDPFIPSHLHEQFRHADPKRKLVANHVGPVAVAELAFCLDQQPTGLDNGCCTAMPGCGDLASPIALDRAASRITLRRKAALDQRAHV
jgi:hypothetical protein